MINRIFTYSNTPSIYMWMLLSNTISGSYESMLRTWGRKTAWKANFVASPVLLPGS